MTHQDADLILCHHITSIHGMTDVLESLGSISEMVILNLMLFQSLFATWMLFKFD